MTPQQDAPHHHRSGPGRGPSSYAMQDPELVFRALAPRPGDHVLDLGCGPGDYALRLAREVGPAGVVHALDRSAEAIRGVRARAEARGLANVRAMAHDITEPLPLADHGLDLCFMATVLHILGLTDRAATLLDEVRRVLKVGGRLAVLECKKEDRPWGPPLERRIAPEDLARFAEAHGLAAGACTDLGVMYLLQFTLRPDG